MTTTTESSDDVNDFEDFHNHVAYNRMRAELEEKYPHQWVVIHKQQFMGHYDTYDAAREGAKQQNLHLAYCVIQKLNANPAVFLSYGV